ncbi:MAG: D-glycerate dehydrogenase [Acidimicrobiales bacterium]
MTPPAVLVTLPVPAASLERLREHCDVTCMSPRDDRAGFELALAVAEGLLVDSRTLLDGDLLRRASNLRAVSTVSVGLDHIDLEAARERRIAVTTTPVLSDAVADLVLALMIMLTRRLPEAARAATSGRWSQAPLGNDLGGKVLLLVGFGRIGQEVARRSLACKMRVGYWDRRDDLPLVEGVERELDFEGALRAADFVSLHVDLNASTAHLIGSKELALMKPTAFLVNTARGGVVDQEALRRALAEGRLAGAALDVLEQEPPLAGEPLLSEPRAIVVPHIGSATVETRAAMLELGIDNLLGCLHGDSGRYAVVDPRRPVSSDLP